LKRGGDDRAELLLELPACCCFGFPFKEFAYGNRPDRNSDDGSELGGMGIRQFVNKTLVCTVSMSAPV